MIPMRPVERHLFVCTNDRSEGKTSCGGRGSGAVLAALQREVGADPALWGRVAVTSCGCLGPCYEGPTVAVWPDGVWYVGVQPGDAPEIVERHVRGGTPVERLRYPFEED